MKNFFAFFKRPWVLPLLAIILFAIVIWFVGPHVAIAGVVPLAGETTRLLVIMAVIFIWGINNLRVKRQADNANRNLAENLARDAKTDQAPEANATAGNNEENILNQRLQDSLKLLKGSRFDRDGKLYKLPWYIIIGAPGSGKTTAIKQSGLQFPLQQSLGNEPVKGEGGTRYCDWWFTDDAILIDTAGRYTTQESGKKVESSAWLGFLSRIKKARPKRPLNGIIVTISIADILNKTATQKRLQIDAIKARIQELNNHLEMSIPVYVTFSKMDLVAGFNSFFANLEKDQRQDIWGFTLASPPKSEESIQQTLENKFGQLITQLYQRVNHRLRYEPSQQQRSLVCDFPRQMQALEGQITDFISQIFASNQFESALWLRGLFFLSSTQTPMAAQWVTSLVPQEHCAPPTDGNRREPQSFFVQKLLKELIFAEANVASVNKKVRRRYRIVYGALLALSFSGFAGMLYAWSNSNALNNEYIERLNASIEEYHDKTQGGLEDARSWQAINQGLSLLRQLPSGFDDDADHSYRYGFGLYQGDKLSQQATSTYLESLQSYFLPDVAQMLSDQIRVAHNDDEQLYEALKFYLMLYNPDHLEPKTFQIWADILWQRMFPAESQDALRAQLNSHLAAAISHGVAPPPMDKDTVADARAILIQTPIDLRAYRRIRNDFISTNPEHFSLVSILGKKAEHLFFRPSGLSLSEGVPTFFSFEGFHSGLNLSMQSLASQLNHDQWIYGDAIEQGLTDEAIEGIQENVRQHYFDEYTTRWESFLSDIELQPFGTVNRGRSVVRILSGADQPLVTLLKQIRRNTDLAKVPELDKDAKRAINNLAQDFAGSQHTRLNRLVPQGIITNNTRLPGQEVSDHFFAVNDYIQDGTGLPLANLQQAILGLNSYLVSLSYADDLGQEAFSSTSSNTQSQALKALQIAIGEAPDTLQPWFSSLSKNTQNVAIVASKTHINSAWKSDVLSFYNQFLAGKYPLDKSSNEDIKLADFSEFFKTGGVLDSYFQQYVAPYADTTSKPWRWKKPSGMSSKTLAFFQQVELIRSAFFSGGETLAASFTLKPRNLDHAASRVSIKTGDTQLDYFHGPFKSQTFTWPGQDPNHSEITFTLASKGTPITAKIDGEWSWFRLLDQYASSKKQNTNGDLQLTFAYEGLTTVHTLAPTASINPFSQPLLAEFTLPSRL